MRKNNIQFVQGDPLPAAKHNGLVLSAGETVRAFAEAHEADGHHSEVRLEIAMACARWNGSAWVPAFGDKGRGLMSGLRTQLDFAFDDSAFRVLSDEQVGFIAFDDQGNLIACSNIFRNPLGELAVTFHPASNSNEVYVTMLGRRSVGA